VTAASRYAKICLSVWALASAGTNCLAEALASSEQECGEDHPLGGTQSRQVAASPSDVLGPVVM
jgi:hypothetical protein